jgi:hypothetical protein
VLVDPGDARYAVAFNPLACGITDPGETASLLMDSFLKAWGQRSYDETPRLEGLMRGLFRLLIEGNMTLLEGYDVLDPDQSALRRALRERVGDHFVRRDFEEFEKLPRPDKTALVESTRNRLRRILHAAPLQYMFGQVGNTLDIRQILDEGKYLIVNLNSVSAPETQRLLGSLMMNAVYHSAKRRNSCRPRDWFLIADEFGEFATRDFANALDQLRKFGVHMILAHQRLGQLEREDPDVLSAVMTNAKLKVVFGGLERVEAERMSRELYTGAVTGDRVKHAAIATKFRPVMDTVEVFTESGSESDGESDNWSASSGSSVSSSDSDGESFDSDRWDSTEPDEIHRSRSRGSSSSESESRGSGGGSSRTTTRGWSRSRVPITRSEEFREETSRQFYGLDEEWERRVAAVHSLAKREAVVRVYNGPVMHVRTPDVEPERQDARAERFHTAVLSSCPNAKAVTVVTAEIEERRREVRLLAEAAEENGLPFNPRSFRE